MTLTNENYYSKEADLEFMSVSQYKVFRQCEAMGYATVHRLWERPKTTALLVGSYVDSWFEGTLDEFRMDNPELFKRDGSLRAEFAQAEELIEFVKRDQMFMDYMAGQKQIILTRQMFGTFWKIKIDSYHPGNMIVDLKVMRSIDRVMGRSFAEHWGYDLQMAVYSAVEGNDLETYLAVVTKENPPNKEIIHIPRWRRMELLDEVEKSLPRILAVKSGRVAPERCGVCEYCRATKMLSEPIDFELVGLSAAERRAILGG